MTVPGCAGAIPVVPNPGDADTVATGAAGEATVDVAVLMESSTGDVSPDTGGPAAVGATVEVDDNAPVPQPATTVSTASTAMTAGARHRNRRRVPYIAVTPGPAGDQPRRRRVGGDGVAGDREPAPRVGVEQVPHRGRIRGPRGIPFLALEAELTAEPGDLHRSTPNFQTVGVICHEETESAVTRV